ncbi:MAG: hypothetical protein V4438_04285 [Patescibacteria group bacterium]
MNEEYIKQDGFGLHPLPPKAPKEQEDFSLAGVFGIPALPCLPEGDFFVSSPIKIKTQALDDNCSGCATAAVSEDQEGEELSGEFQFFVTKTIVLKGSKTWGADLRSAALSSVNVGSLPQSIADMHLKDPHDRDAVLNPDTWPCALFEIAKRYAKGSMFKIDYPWDTFTNIRAALYQHRYAITSEKNSILLGSKWYPDWTHAPNGVIPKFYSQDNAGGHAFKCFGQKLINGEIYLAMQLSNGEEIGDKGEFYFPKDVVNKEFTPYGQFMLNDMPKEKAKFLSNNGLSVNSSPIAKGLAHVIHFFDRFFL